MQTRARNALVFAAGLAVVAAAVIFVVQRRDPARLPATTLDAIPEGALLVATAELEPLRRSGIAAPLLGEGREIPGLGKVRDVCGFDPMTGLTELAVAVPASGNDGAFGLVASGLIDRDALIACASKVIEARGGRSVVNTIGAFRTVRDASGSGSGAEIAVREGGPVLLGAGNYLRAMIDAADGHIPSARSDAAHTRLATDIGRGALRVTVVFSEEQRRLLAEELSRSDAKSSPAASVVGLGLAVSLGERVDLHGVVACDKPAACGELAKIFDARRAAQSEDMIVRLLGLGAALDRMKIVAEGERIHGRVDMATDEVTGLVERLLVLRAASQRKEEAGDKPLEDERPPRKPEPAEALPSGTRDAGAPTDAGPRR